MLFPVSSLAPDPLFRPHRSSGLRSPQDHLAWALTWHSLKFTSAGDLPPWRQNPSPNLMSRPHPHSLPLSHALCASQHLTSPLPTSLLSNPTASHNHMPFTRPFSSPSASLLHAVSSFSSNLRQCPGPQPEGQHALLWTPY